jgi:polyhydroxyalkanoate synthase subunit PhaE
MGEKKEDPFGFEAMIGAWTETMNAFWGGVVQPAASAKAKAKAPPETDDNKASSAHRDTMEKAVKRWQTMAAAMSAPESVGALLKSAGAMPDILAQLTQSSLDSLMELQRKAMAQANRIGASVEAYRFENLDENIFHVWTEIYDKEFRRFFQIPQLGLTRTYQEKLNTAMDAYNRFQSTFAEFLRLLTLPFGQAMAVMQDQMGELAANGQLPDDSQDYYRMWVKVLEGHFMTLFQTPEYVETLGETIGVLTEFSEAKNALLEDMLQCLPIASRTELDDLARQVYELKKRVRQLEQRKPAKPAGRSRRKARQEMTNESV